MGVVVLAKANESKKNPARQARKSEKKAKISSARKKSRPLKFDLQLVRLYGSDFTQKAESDEPEEEDIDYRFGAYVQYFLDEDREVYGTCYCQARKLIGDDESINIDARYMFALKAILKKDADNIEEIVKHVAKNMIWPLFRLYFSYINAQASLELPDLPYDPKVFTEFVSLDSVDD